MKAMEILNTAKQISKIGTETNINVDKEVLGFNEIIMSSIKVGLHEESIKISDVSVSISDNKTNFVKLIDDKMWELHNAGENYMKCAEAIFSTEEWGEGDLEGTIKAAEDHVNTYCEILISIVKLFHSQYLRKLGFGGKYNASYEAIRSLFDAILQYSKYRDGGLMTKRICDTANRGTDELAAKYD